MINPRWLELLMSRTNFQDPKDVRVIEVRLYLYVESNFNFSYISLCDLDILREKKWLNYLHTVGRLIWFSTVLPVTLLRVFRNGLRGLDTNTYDGLAAIFIRETMFVTFYLLSCTPIKRLSSGYTSLKNVDPMLIQRRRCFNVVFPLGLF